MVQLRDEAEGQVLEPETAVTPDPLFDESEIEQQDYLVQVDQLQDDQLPETDWEQIALAFPEFAPAMPNVTVGQDGHAVSVNPENDYSHGHAVGSIAGAERDDEDTEALHENEEVVRAGDDTIPDSVELHDETRTQTAQPDSEPLVEPDVLLPRNVTAPASPSISQRGSTQGMLDNDDDEDEAAPTTAPQPPHSPPPVSPPPRPRTSSAPPNYSPVKTRKPRSNGPRATKEPRAQPLSPNAQLSDTDSTKLWCVCRGVDDGEKMILCAEPRCREKWFHFACVGLERSPPRERDWWCVRHRAMTARQREKAERDLERAAVRRGRGDEWRRQGKGVAKVVKRKGEDGATERSGKKAKTKTK